MSGFSPEWLSLREPADQRARDAGIGRLLAEHFAERAEVSVVDLGCGTGSNLRATSALLGDRQSWTLVDHDPGLLAAARARLAAWADRADAGESSLVLRKAGRRIAVAFRQADLMSDLDAALGPAPDLVTASALFDLCSPVFIGRFAEAVARRRAVFHTVLTYNGQSRWTPVHAADADASRAFNRHQRTDKGFGPAAGAEAPAILAAMFAAHGYTVAEGDSPWRLGADDGALVAELAAGFAGAVAETGAVAAEPFAEWRRVVRVGAEVGHTDTLALPV